jgi:hypothetical protein
MFSKIQPYRFNRQECYLLKRIEKVFLKSEYSFYRWPEIYFGNFNDFPMNKILHPEENYEEVGELYFMNIDYLGIYIYEKSREGYIRVYKDRIIECANRIAKKLQINISEVINDLLTIVLLHEIGHWFTHSCHLKNTQQRLEGFAYQDKIIIESMAQLTVVWAIMKLKNRDIVRLSKIFDYLVDCQSYPYQAFKKLGKKQTHIKTLLKRYGNIADDFTHNLGYDFNYFLNGDKVLKKMNKNFGKHHLFNNNL